MPFPEGGGSWSSCPGWNDGDVSLSLPALAQEGGDEDTGVQVERGVPPAVREVQDLQDTPVGSHGSGWGAWGPLQPLDSPPQGAGCTPAGAGPVAGWDMCAGARPASSRWGGSAGFYRAGTETSAGKHQGHIPSQFPSSPSGSAPGGLPRGQRHLLGAVSLPLPQILPLGLSSHLPAENHLGETRAVPVEGNARA